VSKRLLPVFLPIVFAGVAAVSIGCSSVSVGRSPAVSPADINSRKAQAHTLIESGDYEAAVALLSPLAESKARDSQIYTMLGEAHWRLGDHDKAATRFEDALRLDYADWQAHMKLAQMLTEAGKVGRALTEFGLAIKYGERESLAHYNYGLSLFEFGRRDEAIAEWEVALSLERKPEYAQALGMGFNKRRDDKALEYFELAEELGARSATFHNNFGLLLTRTGDYRRAEIQLAAAVEAKPESEPYRTNLAVLHMRAGHFEEAALLWEDLLDVSPAGRVPRTYLGKCYYELQRFSEAVEVLEAWLLEQAATHRKDTRASRNEPGLGEGFDTLAMSYRGLENLDRALEYAVRAVDLEPVNPAYLNNYGVILAESGKIEQAKAQWVKVLDLEPDNAVAKQNLSAFDR
jgi:tetratricopeptide (TPR) repeat protein